ncbi:MAG TPA: DUF4292 domain-containing protein [Anaeromyxobacter sp.]
MRRLGLELLLAVALAACAPRVPPPNLSLEPVALLAQVRAAGAQVVRVQGESRLRVDGPGARGVAPGFVAVERPDRLRVEVHDFFGNPVSVLVSAGGRLALYDARGRVFYRGAASPANVARLVPIALSPERLVAILCGTPLLEGEPERAAPGRGFVALDLVAGPRRTNLRVGPRAAIERATLRGGAPAVPDHEVRYGGFLDLPGARVPTEIAITAEPPAIRVELGWKEPEVNGPLDSASFRLDPPSGARIVDLDEADLSPPPPLLPGSPAPTAEAPAPPR